MHEKICKNNVILQQSGKSREHSETVMVQQRENFRKINAVKRISRNSIALFSFTGRTKKKDSASNTMADVG